MRLTDRDIDLIKWANGFGCVTTSQVATWMAVDLSTAARRIRILSGGDVLERRNIPLLRNTAILPTRTGCQVAGDALAPLSALRLATARHDLLLVDCAYALEQRFGGRFEPERRLRQRGFSVGDHLPDGLLHLNDGQLVAVELELTPKSSRRLDAILDSYAADLSVSTVWYVVIDDPVENQLKRAAADRAHVKVRRWKPTPAARAAQGDRP